MRTLQRISIILCILVCLQSSSAFISPSLQQLRPLGSLQRIHAAPRAAAVKPAPAAPADRVVPVELNEEVSSSFLQYAMSTILARALPDARDGLKPVHRRILYAMHGLGLVPGSGYRKCARVVGEVLGKYHPHGDTAVYDALVRMAQDFVTNAPLVAGHGNFGSIDADPPAAMRYTECKLTPVAMEALLSELDLDTVDFAANFDGNEKEPLVLPAKLPMLLLNGGSGIAVGMATSVPPHNLGEVADAVVALVDNPSLKDEELVRIIPAPDFPTGGKIMGATGYGQMYATGHGSVTVRATTHIENLPAKGGRQGRNAIVITEFPYMTNKASMLEKIAELVNDHKLEGIADLRDESDREGIRVVVELKRDAIPSVVESNLFKKTQLQTTISMNMVALVNNGTQPTRLGLKEYLQQFIAFRFDCIRRRTAFQLDKLRNREHIVAGMIKALGKIDEIIALVKGSKDTADAREKLMKKKFNLSEKQADAILQLRLARLTAMEEKALKEEQANLLAEIKQLLALMTDDKRVYETIKEETLQLKQKFATPRKSEILAQEGVLQEENLIPNERSVIMITRSGYIKRMPVRDFGTQHRGTRGKAGTKLADEEDVVAQFFACNDHDHVLFISNHGIAYGLRAWQIPIASRTAKGTPLPQVLPLSAEDGVSSALPVQAFNEDEYIVMLTRGGRIKRTALSAFKKLTARGLTAMKIDAGDSLAWVRVCKESDDVLISTQHGFATRFRADDTNLRPLGRTARGVTAMRLRDGDSMVDMDIIPAGYNETVVAITQHGIGKQLSMAEFRPQRRGGMGKMAIRFREAGDGLACLRSCTAAKEVVLSTASGVVMRAKLSEILARGRYAKGVTLQKLDKGDRVVAVDMVYETAANAHNAGNAASPEQETEERRSLEEQDDEE